jgi:hypothetical protein
LGFPKEVAEIIHAFVGGSALHGVKLHGTDETDVYGNSTLGQTRFNQSEVRLDMRLPRR